MLLKISFDLMFTFKIAQNTMIGKARFCMHSIDIWPHISYLGLRIAVFNDHLEK